MFGKSKNGVSHRELDRLGTEIVRAGVPGDVEIERAASSPSLFARVMADARSPGVQGGERSGLGTPGSEERRGPSTWLYRLQFAAAVLVVFCATGFWVLRARPQQGAAYVRVTSEARLTACSVSNRDKCVISTDDVVELLASGGSGNNQEVGK